MNDSNQTLTLSVTIGRETRDVEFKTLGDGTRAWSKQVAYCQRGGKPWACSLTAYLKDGTWKVSMIQTRLNRVYPVAGWLDHCKELNLSKHNSA